MNLNELKRLAREAQAEVGIVPGPKRMAFVRAANPAAVLDLLSERDALKAENEKERRLREAAYVAGWELVEEADDIRAENERLRDLIRRSAGILRDLAGMPIEADLLEAMAQEKS